MDTLLAPLRIASSRPARRAYITTFLLTTSATFLLLVAAASYIAFYMNYIPHLSHRHPLHLQFSPKQYPTALLQLPPSSTKPNQHYTITLHLHLPTTSTNYAIGNFMADLTLLSPTGNTLSHARRPSTLTHRSPLLETLDTLVRAPLYLTGVRTQAERLSITLLDASFAQAVGGLKLVLEAEQLGVYDATIEFRARFEGLRWWMYNRRITVFVFATALFWAVEVVAMALVWWAVASWFGSPAAAAGGEGGRAGAGGGEEREGEEGGEMYADDEETEGSEVEVKVESPEMTVDSGLGSMSENASSSRARAADMGQRRRRSRRD